jgi:hypothetical protein
MAIINVGDSLMPGSRQASPDGPVRKNAVYKTRLPKVRWGIDSEFLRHGYRPARLLAVEERR